MQKPLFAPAAAGAQFRRSFALAVGQVRHDFREGIDYAFFIAGFIVRGGLDGSDFCLH